MKDFLFSVSYFVLCTFCRIVPCFSFKSVLIPSETIIFAHINKLTCYKRLNNFAKYNICYHENTHIVIIVLVYYHIF